MPRDTRYAFTAWARRSDRAWLYESDPIESVCPSIRTLIVGIVFQRLRGFIEHRAELRFNGGLVVIKVHARAE